MKKNYLLFLSFLFSAFLNAQVYNNTTLTIQNGLTITANNGFVTQSGGYTDNNGIIEAEIQWSNENSSGGISINTGIVRTKGSSTVLINGSQPSVFNELQLNADTRLETGITGDISAKVYGNAEINNADLNTYGRVFELLSSSSSSLTASSGFVYDGSTQTNPFANAGVIRWHIGTATGIYDLPFKEISSGNAIPVSLSISGGASGTGYFDFSTYKASFDNQPYPGSPNATNMGLESPDNSDEMINRFWRIKANGYSTQPNFTASLNYLNDETCIGFGCGTTITESRLGLYNWNDINNEWDLNVIGGTTNTLSNTYTTSSFNNANGWYVLADRCAAFIVDIATDTLFCSPHTLGTTISGGTGTLTYSWSPNTFLSSTTSASPTTSTNEDITYLVNVTDQMGCSDTSDIVVEIVADIQPACVVTVDSATASYNILVWEKPIDISAIDSFIIYREITTGNWQQIGAKHRDSLSQFKDMSVNPNSTAYAYKIGVLDTCGVYGAYNMYHKSIHLQYLSNGNFQWTLYEIESTSNPVASYNFYRDNAGTGNFQFLQTIPGTNDTYQDVNYLLYPNAQYRVDVNWLSSNICTPTRAGVNTSRSNIKNAGLNGNTISEEILSGISVYPNPANEILNINYGNISGNTEIQIFDAIGKLVFSSNEKLNSIDISGFADGVYTLQVKTAIGIKNLKVVKE